MDPLHKLLRGHGFVPSTHHVLPGRYQCTHVIADRWHVRGNVEPQGGSNCILGASHNLTIQRYNAWSRLPRFTISYTSVDGFVGYDDVRRAGVVGAFRGQSVFSDLDLCV